MTIKAIAFDYDGTLSSLITSQVSETALKALNIAQEKGLKLVLCTGRQANVVPLLEGRLEPDYRVGCSGATIFNKKLEIIKAHYVDLDTYNEINDFCELNNIPLFWKFSNRYSVRVDFELWKKFLNQAKCVVFEHVDGTKELPSSGCVSKTAEKVNDFKRRFAGKIQITDGGQNNLDLDIVGINKGLGLKEVAELMDIKLEEIIAFGDSFNDIPMIKAAGIGVAMDSGAAELKQVADYVTESPDEDGIWNALKHYGVI